MIYYRPTDGDPLTSSPPSRPNTCFLMTQLGSPLPAELPEIHSEIADVLTNHGYALVNAESLVTGKDFLLGNWSSVCRWALQSFTKRCLRKLLRTFFMNWV